MMPGRKTSELPKAAIQMAFLSLFLALGVTVVSAQGSCLERNSLF